MSDLTLSFDGEVGGIFTRIARGVSAGLPTALVRAAEEAAGELRRTSQMLTKSGQQKGGLARSWKAQLNAVQGDVLSAGAYSAMPYAKIQNEGGVIRAKKRMLAIPVKGVAVRGKWPRDYPQGFLFRVNNLLVHKTENTKRGKYRKGTLFGLKIYFVLKRSVKLEPTGYIDYAAESVAPKVEAIINEALGRAAKEA